MKSSIEENEGDCSSAEIHLELDDFRSFNHVLLTALGVPLNLLIVIVILTNQRLKKKPRNIIFLGASLSAVLTLLTIFVEFLAYQLQSLYFCKIFGLSTGVAYSCLLFNLALALLDRYLAIVRPLLHRKVVTVRSVLITQAIGTVVIFFLFKWPYVFGVVPLQCGFILIEGKITAVTNALLIFLIVSLNIIVYVKTKHYARPDRTVSVSFLNDCQPENPDGDEEGQQQATVHLVPTNTAHSTNNGNNNQQERSEPHPTPAPTCSATRVNSIAPRLNMPLQIHGGNRRMEIEATYTLLIGVSSLLMFTTPMLSIASIELGCLWIVGGTDNGEKHCSRIFMISLPYCREFLLYHLVYNPIMYMIRSKEFSSTLTEKWTRTNRRRQCLTENRIQRIPTSTRLPRSSQLANALEFLPG